VHHAFHGLGVAVSILSVYPSTIWFLTGTVLAATGALIGALHCWRSR
jgi:hypothetical protein